MHKVGWIIALVFLYITGCSTARRSANSIKNQGDKIILADLYGNVRKFNITNNDFYIKKAEIEVYNNNEKQKLLGSIKYKKSGEYLLSIKLKNGIEAARFYLSKDTILINDRINKTLYYGSPEYLEKKYGIAISFLPFLLGDFSEENEILKMEEQCVKGQMGIESSIKEKKLQLVIDCELIKIRQLQLENIDKSAGINMEFEDFYKTETIEFPRSIRIEDFMSESVIKIFIRKIEIPWEGVLEFIGGNNYETVMLR
ncbi:MAG: DUF4292 domain-containing protein [Bacteroidales bacterium]|nr:DUF4292 domain-containing protein [Bacteroidales bacterium]